jgi:hypothetical protein
MKYKLKSFTCNLKEEDQLENLAFGFKNKKFDVDNVHPESEQLGVLIDTSQENEMERLSFDQDQPMDIFGPKPDIQGHEDPLEKDEILSTPYENMEVDANLHQNTPSLSDEINWGCENKEENKGEEDEKEDDSISFSHNTSKEIRWRKEDDKKLFATYRILCRKQMLNLREVVSAPLKKNKKHK